jgi:iron complex outermembrane receptor protein
MGAACCRIVWILLLACVTATGAMAASQQQADPSDPDDSINAPPTPSVHLTEEVEVVARAPRPGASSSVSLIEGETIEKVSHHNLANVFAYAAGSSVSMGTKNEWSLQIRGLNAGKIALLYDGIPIYEPYFGSFNLNSVTAEEVDSIRILRGTPSVLYGPNVLGGVVNVMTKRPDANAGSANASYGSFEDLGLGGTGTARRGSVGAMGSVSHHSIGDFEWKNDAGEVVPRQNSDYQTTNLTGKLYYYPGKSSEIMAEVGYLTSEYGIPAATEHYRPRHWRFSDWSRLLFNVGATVPLSSRGYLKARGYYVSHDNVLDAYRTAALDQRQWRSTHDNHSYGAFALGSLLLNERNEVKLSLNGKSDQVRTQSDVGEEWERFSQQTLSFGAEHHLSLGKRWTVVGGASIDYLDKEEGNNKTAVNPILGVRFDVNDKLELTSSLSRKSRFPTMKDLYGSQAGNPDLREERGTNFEAGFVYTDRVRLTGAVFHKRIRDLIQSIRNADGWRMPVNVGRAQITGFELGVKVGSEKLKLSADYAYLDSKDMDTDQPLPLVPESQISVILDVLPRPDWTLSFWGTGGLGSQTYFNDEPLVVPDYFVLNGSVTKTFGRLELSARVENLLDASYVTEPEFPMPSRSFRAVLRFRGGPQP